MPRGMATPVLLKWFVNGDVPTCAPFSSNDTIIPIMDLVYCCPKGKFFLPSSVIRMSNAVKGGVLSSPRENKVWQPLILSLHL